MHTADATVADVAMLRRIMDKLPSMLAYWDSTLHCRFANRAYETWFGVSPESLIGKHVSTLLGPLYPLNLPYMRAALGGELQVFEREIPDPSGGPSRHSLAHYIPDASGGSVRGFIAHVTDISQLKRAQIALRTSEAKFSTIVSIAQDAIITMDEQQRISVFNASAEKTFGYTSGEMLGASLELLIPPRFREAHRHHVGAFASKPGTATRSMHSRGVLVGLRKNGEEFPFEASISKFAVDGTKLLTVALRDISERERADREQRVLAEAGAVLASSLDFAMTLKHIARLVVDTVADICAVDMLDSGQNVVSITVAHRDPSKAAACDRLSRLRLPRAEVLASSAFVTQEPQVVPEITDEALRAMATRPEYFAILQELGPPRSAIVAPLLTTRGVIGAIVMSSLRPNHFQRRDLTLATELARRAAMAIENATLYAAAQRATKARDDALAIVAHDVRNPIATIHLAATTLEREMGGGRAPNPESVQVVLRAAKRANRLIQDLLDISRIEGGALSIAREPLLPTQLVADAIDAQRLLAGAAEVKIESNTSDELPQIGGDRHRLLQVFENLIGNALKFLSPGGTVTIGAAPSGGDVLFSVADTGPGIAPDHVPHVFDRFWQADRADRKGAGLGLPICEGIVEAHGGRIWVESTLGRGTTFFFTIPSRSRS